MNVSRPGAQYVSYVLTIAGVLSLTGGLVSLIAPRAAPLIVALLLPADDGLRKVSLVEQRAIEAANSVPPLPQGARGRLAVLEAPSASAAVLAAQLDAAEGRELTSEPRRSKRHLAFDDGISFPSLPQAASLKALDRHRHRPAYADLRERRFAARDYPSAAEEFRRRFAPSFADAR